MGLKICEDADGEGHYAVKLLLTHGLTTATTNDHKEVTMKRAHTNRTIVPIKNVAFALALFIFLISPAAKHAAWSQDQPTINDILQEVGLKVTAFGGMFVDEQKDTLYVYMVPDQPGEIPDVDKAITAVFGSYRPPQHNLVALPGQYTFLELKDWRDHMSPQLLPLPGVVSVGIDLVKNRLSVNVLAPVVASQVEAELLALGVPRDAVHIEQTGPIIQEVSLRDKKRPLYGGLQIQRDKRNQGRCTLGLVAQHIADGTIGLVTASHCGNIAFPKKNDPKTTKFYQAVVADGQVATEFLNPPLVGGILGNNRNVCPASVVCRLSDTLFAQILNKDDASKQGYIAKPPLNNTNNPDDGGKGWNGTDSYRIIAESVYFLPGASITKVGRTTGRTEGTITAVCVDENNWGNPNNLAGDPPRSMLCQDEANYFSGPGDSGSPVFHVIADKNDGCTEKRQNNDVCITGIHWGAETRSTGRIRIFSAIGLVQDNNTELGALKMCAPGFAC